MSHGNNTYPIYNYMVNYHQYPPKDNKEECGSLGIVSDTMMKSPINLSCGSQRMGMHYRGRQKMTCWQPAARYRAGKHKWTADSHDGQRVLEGLCVQRRASWKTTKMRFNVSLKRDIKSIYLSPSNILQSSILTFFTEYCSPSDFTWKSAASLQLRVLAVITHFISRNVLYILKVEYSTSNVVIMYFNFIILYLLTNTSFTISIMTEYTVAVSCRFASFDNLYKIYYRQRYLLTVIVTDFIWPTTSLLL